MNENKPSEDAIPVIVNCGSCNNEITSYCLGSTMGGQLIIFTPMRCPACQTYVFWQKSKSSVEVPGRPLQVARIKVQ